jgi:HSP20 family protein
MREVDHAWIRYVLGVHKTSPRELLEEPTMVLRNATVRDFDRLTARVFDTPTRTSGCRLDTYRDRDTFFVDIDLPGVDSASIDIAIDGRLLTVRAERKCTGPMVAERATGEVSREVVLSESLDTDRLDARYENGVLTLRIPIAGELASAA